MNFYKKNKKKFTKKYFIDSILDNNLHSQRIQFFTQSILLLISEIFIF